MIAATANFIAACNDLSLEPIYALEVEGYSRVLTMGRSGVAGHYPWISTIDDLTIQAQDLEGHATLSDLNVHVLDQQRLFTGDLSGFTFEGRLGVLKAGFVGLAYADFCTLYTGKITTVPMMDNDLGYTITVHDRRQDLKQVIYQVADDGQPTSSQHIKTLTGHPLDLLLDILEAQCGLSSADVDETKIIAYRDGLFAGMEMAFELTTAPDALEFCQKQIMKPLGGYLWTNNLGVVTVHFFSPLPGTSASVASLTDRNLVELPRMDQADLINVLTLRFDKSTGSSDYLSELVTDDSVSVAKYNMQGQQIIEADGLRSALQGYLTGVLTAQMLFARYGNKNPKCDVLTLWSLCRLELGDLVTLTHNLVPNRVTGVMGINQSFEVLSRTWKFNDHSVAMTLVDGTGAIVGKYKITVDAEPVWTSASSGDKSTLMFISNATGHYSDAVDGNTLG